MVPAGLVEPEARYPHAKAEVMAGEVPLAPGEGRLPASREEVGVGPERASAIGWREWTDLDERMW